MDVCKAKPAVVLHQYFDLNKVSRKAFLQIRTSRSLVGPDVDAFSRLGSACCRFPQIWFSRAADGALSLYQLPVRSKNSVFSLRSGRKTSLCRHGDKQEVSGVTFSSGV